MKQILVVGSLPFGLSIEGVIYKNFEMREALLADMIEAEAEAGSVHNSIHYNAQMAALQLVKVSAEDGTEYKGPFVVSMIKKRADFIALRNKQIELDALGNVEQSGSETTGTPSS
jgi:hypothetical protein